MNFNESELTQHTGRNHSISKQQVKNESLQYKEEARNAYFCTVIGESECLF